MVSSGATPQTVAVLSDGDILQKALDLGEPSIGRVEAPDRVVAGDDPDVPPGIRCDLLPITSHTQ